MILVLVFNDTIIIIKIVIINNMDKCNIKYFETMNDYTEKIYISFQSLCDIFKSFRDELQNFLNDLNFRDITKQLIDTYNRLLLFLYDRVKGVLLMTFTNDDSMEILIIKQARNNKYYHNLEMTYLIENDVVTKPLGSITTANIEKNDACITLYRADTKFSFVTFDLSMQITNDDMRKHINEYIDTTKEIIQWWNSDVKTMKLYIKTLAHVIEEHINRAKHFPKNELKLWISLVEKITKNKCLLI